ncbi:hypothetical protein AVEN_108685-1, partial [Araneus ventricosus]
LPGWAISNRRSGQFWEGPPLSPRPSGTATLQERREFWSTPVWPKHLGAPERSAEFWEPHNPQDISGGALLERHGILKEPPDLGPENLWFEMILRIFLLWCLRIISAQEYSGGRSQRIKHEPTYFIAASRNVRPGQTYAVTVTVFRSALHVRASIQREGVELAAAWHDCKPNVPETLLLKVSTSRFCVYYCYLLSSATIQIDSASYSGTMRNFENFQF